MLDGTKIVEEGSEGSGAVIRKEHNMPDNGPARRKWALTPSNRDAFVFEGGREYRGDFHNGYLDFSDFSLKLPGFSLNVMKYIDDKTHRLRYVFKNRETGDVYFVVVFGLLFGDELAHAVSEDAKIGAGGTGQPHTKTEKHAKENDEHSYHDDDVD